MGTNRADKQDSASPKARGSQVDNSVVIYEDWNERDGKIYYRWRVEGEKVWHEKLTAYKQKPTIQWQRLSQEQVNDLLIEGSNVNTDAANAPKSGSPISRKGQT